MFHSEKSDSCPHKQNWLPSPSLARQFLLELPDLEIEYSLLPLFKPQLPCISVLNTTVPLFVAHHDSQYIDIISQVRSHRLFNFQGAKIPLSTPINVFYFEQLLESCRRAAGDIWKAAGKIWAGCWSFWAGELWDNAMILSGACRELAERWRETIWREQY